MLQERNLIWNKLNLKEKLYQYTDAKQYVMSDFPDLCQTRADTMKQAYDEAKQYLYEFQDQ